MKEQAILFGKDSSIVGVLTESSMARLSEEHNSTGVILLSPGHHVGPSCINVKLARLLSSMNYDVLRFDYSGLGDSGPRRDKLPEYLSVIDETQSAMDYLEQFREVKHFVLMGLCSGGSSAFRVAALDCRVRGAVLINLPIPQSSEHDITRQYLYYWQVAMLKLDSWKRFLLFKSDYRGIFQSLRLKIAKVRSSYIGNTEHAHVVGMLKKSLSSILGRKVQLLIIRSDNVAGDQFIREFMPKEYVSLLDAGLLRIGTIPDADHAITPLASQRRLLGLISEWMTEKYK